LPPFHPHNHPPPPLRLLAPLHHIHSPHPNRLLHPHIPHLHIPHHPLLLHLHPFPHQFAVPSLHRFVPSALPLGLHLRNRGLRLAFSAWQQQQRWKWKIW